MWVWTMGNREFIQILLPRDWLGMRIKGLGMRIKAVICWSHLGLKITHWNGLSNEWLNPVTSKSWLSSAWIRTLSWFRVLAWVSFRALAWVPFRVLVWAPFWISPPWYSSTRPLSPSSVLVSVMTWDGICTKHGFYCVYMCVDVYECVYVRAYFGYTCTIVRQWVHNVCTGLIILEQQNVTHTPPHCVQVWGERLMLSGWEGALWPLAVNCTRYLLSFSTAMRQQGLEVCQGIVTNVVQRKP